MNNPNPFLPQSSFLEQKNKARARLRIVVLFSISLSVMVLMALLIQGCRKNDSGQASDTGTAPGPEATSTQSPDTNNTVAANNTGNAPENTTNLGTVPPPPTEPSNPPPPPPPPPAAPEPTTSDYTVVKGDTLAIIAKNNHVLVKALENANQGVDPKRLKIGQKLHIPAATSVAPMVAPGTPGATTEAEATPGGEQTYKVKSGDTLTGIAKKFHVSIKAIQSENNLKTTSIRVGQTLKIPSKAAPAPEAAPAETAPPAPTTTPAMPQPSLAPATTSNH